MNLFSDDDVIRNVIYEGAVLFICTALMGEILIDYILSGLKSVSLLVAMFILTGVILWYNAFMFDWFSFNGKNATTDLMKILKDIQYGLIVFSVLYCMWIKAYLFYIEKRKEL